jgi:hypothetical protein
MKMNLLCTRLCQRSYGKFSKSLALEADNINPIKDTFNYLGFLSPVSLLQETELRGAQTNLYRALRKCTEQSDYSRYLQVKPHLVFPWISELSRTSKIIDLVSNIVGDDILLTSSAIQVKHPHSSLCAPWHQDTANSDIRLLVYRAFFFIIMHLDYQPFFLVLHF